MYLLCHPSAAEGPQEFERGWCSWWKQIFLTKGQAVDRTKHFIIEATFMIYMNSNCCKKSLKIFCMLNVVFDFFICDLKKRFFNHKFWIHAKLPGYIILPDPALYLCKKFFTRHEIRTVGRKKKNNRSCCINCVNRCLWVVDSCFI